MDGMSISPHAETTDGRFVSRLRTSLPNLQRLQRDPLRHNRSSWISPGFSLATAIRVFKISDLPKSTIIECCYPVDNQIGVDNSNWAEKPHSDHRHPRPDGLFASVCDRLLIQPCS